MTATFSNLVATYGLFAVFFFMIGESCGFPFPSEVIMPTAGILAATGRMNLVAAIVAGALANLVGSWIAYGVAARWGQPILLGPGKYAGIRRHHLKLANRWFKRWGMVAVFVGRLLPVVRTYISFPAGLARIDLVRFSILTFVGALPWCAALTLIGFYLGKNYDRVSASLQRGAVVILLLLIAGVILWYLRGRAPDEEEAAA